MKCYLYLNANIKMQIIKMQDKLGFEQSNKTTDSWKFYTTILACNIHVDYIYIF